MGRSPSRGFTLVELLVVILIVSLLMAVLLPVLFHALAVAKHGTTEAFADQIVLWLKTYELDHAFYPPGDGNGSRGLVRALNETGPRTARRFELKPEMLTPEGDLLNPVHSDAPPPINLIHYRNNRGRRAGPDGVGRPGVSSRNEYDLWAAGCDYDPKRPDSAWSIHRP